MTEIGPARNRSLTTYAIRRIMYNVLVSHNGCCNYAFRTLHDYELIIITMTSDRSLFRVTGPLCREFIGHQ